MPDNPVGMDDEERRLWDEVAVRVFDYAWRHGDGSEQSAKRSYEVATAFILERRRRLS